MWGPWVGTGDFLRNGGAGVRDAEWPPPNLPPGMLCPLSSPLPTLMVPVRWCHVSWRGGGHRLGKEKAVNQPGLQVTHSAGEAGRAVVPPT